MDRRFLSWLPASIHRGVCLFLLVACGACEARSGPPDPSVHLFLLVSQSNMAGRAPVAPEDRLPHERVLALDRYAGWQPAVDPLHFDEPTAGAGLGLTFGRTLAQLDEEITVGLIPAAVGGSPISAWRPGGEWWGSEKCHPYDDALARARVAMRDGVLAGILWHQGESDCTELLASDYRSELEALIDRFEEDLGVRGIPFLIGQLGQFDAAPWDAARQEVDAAHRAIASERGSVAFVSSLGLAALEDGVHFDAPALREFGRRYARAYLELAQEPSFQREE